jgi:high-affinity iron transporter
MTDWITPFAAHWTATLPSFVITLREGVEAALVVGIVLAYLKKADQTHLNRWVYSGIATGLAASLFVGVGFAWIFQVAQIASPTYAPVLKPLLEGLFSVVAIALLSWMLVWMTQQSRQLKTQIEGAINRSLQQTAAGWGIFGLIFFAVLREGFETVIFLAAQSQPGTVPIVGATVGFATAVGIGLLLFQVGIKINLRLFFQSMGIFLLLIVAGLVVSTLAHFDLAFSRLAAIHPNFSLCANASGLPEATCFLGTQLWDARRILPEKAFPGIILHTLLGYEDQFYLLEALSYGAFLAIMGGFYWRSLTASDTKPAKL